MRTKSEHKCRMAVKEHCAPVGCGTLPVGGRTSVDFEYNQMTIYRTRYRDPKVGRGISAWAETRVGAEMRRAGIERRYAPRKLEIPVERFEVSPNKPELVRFLNEHAGEALVTVSA